MKNIMKMLLSLLLVAAIVAPEEAEARKKSGGSKRAGKSSKRAGKSSKRAGKGSKRGGRDSGGRRGGSSKATTTDKESTGTGGTAGKTGAAGKPIYTLFYLDKDGQPANVTKEYKAGDNFTCRFSSFGDVSGKTVIACGGVGYTSAKSGADITVAADESITSLADVCAKNGTYTYNSETGNCERAIAYTMYYSADGGKTVHSATQNFQYGQTFTCATKTFKDAGDGSALVCGAVGYAVGKVNETVTVKEDAAITSLASICSKFGYDVVDNKCVDPKKACEAKGKGYTYLSPSGVGIFSALNKIKGCYATYNIAMSHTAKSQSSSIFNSIAKAMATQSAQKFPSTSTRIKVGASFKCEPKTFGYSAINLNQGLVNTTYSCTGPSGAIAANASETVK